MTNSTSLDVLFLEANQNQPEVPVNAGTATIDAAIGQYLVHAVATDASYTLATGTTPAEWIYGTIAVSDTGGTLTAGRDIVIPAREKAYRFVNQTAQVLTLTTATGSGVAVAAARAAILQCDGTDVLRITADSAVT